MASSNWPWNELGIEETDNLREIQAAYAKLLKAIDQKTDLDGFQRLNQAFKTARQIAARKKMLASQPVDSVEEDDIEEYVPEESAALQSDDGHGDTEEQVSESLPDEAESRFEDIPPAQPIADAEEEDEAETDEPNEELQVWELAETAESLVVAGDFKIAKWLPLLNHPALDARENSTIFEGRLVRALTVRENGAKWNWADKTARSAWSDLINVRFGWCDDGIGFIRRYHYARNLLESIIESREIKQSKDSTEAISQFQVSQKKPAKEPYFRFLTPSLLVVLAFFAYNIALSSFYDTSATFADKTFKPVLGSVLIALVLLWGISKGDSSIVKKIRARAPRWTKKWYGSFIPAAMLAVFFAAIFGAIQTEAHSNPVLAERHVFSPKALQDREQQDFMFYEFDDNAAEARQAMIDEGQAAVSAFEQGGSLPTFFPVFYSGYYPVQSGGDDKSIQSVLACIDASLDQPKCGVRYRTDWAYGVRTSAGDLGAIASTPIQDEIFDPVIYFHNDNEDISFAAIVGRMNSFAPLTDVEISYDGQSETYHESRDHFKKIFGYGLLFLRDDPEDRDRLPGYMYGPYLEPMQFSLVLPHQEILDPADPFQMRIFTIVPGPEGVRNKMCEDRVIDSLDQTFGFDGISAREELTREVCTITQEEYPEIWAKECPIGSGATCEDSEGATVVNLDLRFAPDLDKPGITDIFRQMVGAERITDQGSAWAEALKKEQDSMVGQTIEDYRAVLGFEGSSPELVEYLKSTGVTKPTNQAPKDWDQLRDALARQPQLIPLQAARKELAGDVYTQLFATFRKLGMLN